MRPNSRTVSHNPNSLINHFHVMAKDSIAQPVGMKASTHANMSGMERFVNAMAKAMRAMTVSETTPCRKRRASRMLLDFLGLYQNSCEVTMIQMLADELENTTSNLEMKRNYRKS